MSIKIIKSLHKRVEGFLEHEKQFIANYEHRLEFIPKHRKQIRRIIIIIKNYKNQREKELINEINKTIEILQIGFKHLNMDLIDTIKKIDDKIEKDLQNEITNNHNIFLLQKKKRTNSVSDHYMDVIKGSLIMSEKEKNFVTKFDIQIDQFKRIIESQREFVHNELKYLDSLRKNPIDISEDKIKEIEIYLMDYHKRLSNFIHLEQQFLHNPINELYDNISQANRRMFKLLKKETITKNDIQEASRSFSSIADTDAFISELQTNKDLQELMDKKAKKYVEKDLQKIKNKQIKNQEYKIFNLAKELINDYMTNAKNKRAFEIEGEKLNKKAEEDAKYRKKYSKEITYRDDKYKELKFAVLLIDIDLFKLVNDSYNYDVGDAVIKKTVQIIQKTIRKKNDKVFRIGGEEIVVIAHDTDINGGAILANKIRENVFEKTKPLMKKYNKKKFSFLPIIDNLDEQNKYYKKQIKFGRSQISLSIGVAGYPNKDNETNFNNIYKTSNKNLKKAKLKRNSVET